MKPEFCQRSDDEINVIALVKGSERYVWLYPDCERLGVLRSFGRAAANPELSFTWYDAAVLSQKVRQNLPIGRNRCVRDD